MKEGGGKNVDTTRLEKLQKNTILTINTCATPVGVVVESMEFCFGLG